MRLSCLVPLLLLASLSLAVPCAMADDGDPDPSFSADGKATTTWPSTVVDAQTLAVVALGDGVVTAGWIDRGSNNRDFAVAKFRADGEVDTAFADQGQRLVAFDLVAGGDDRALGVFAQAGGKLMVVGTAGLGASVPYMRPALLRLNADGSPDASFGPGGKRIVAGQPFGTGARFNFVGATQARDGKLLLTGVCESCGQGGLPDFVVLRMLADGTPDTGFGNAGWFSFGRVAPDNHYVIEEANAVAVDSQGRVLLIGHEETYQDPNDQQRPLLLRLTASGQLDTSFGGTGYVVVNLIGSWDATAVALDVDDSLVLAINVTHSPSVVPTAALIRVRANGTLDTNFGDNGFVDLGREEGTAITALAIRRDRRITAAGWIDPNGAGDYDFFAARTLADGTLDTSFDGNGVKRVAFDIDVNSYDIAHAITLSGERPVIAGSIADIVGPPSLSTAVLRLQSDLIFADGFY